MSEPDNEASKAAKVLGRLGASKGGKARAASLTPEARSEIARNAVQTRWAKAKQDEPVPSGVLRATFGSPDQPLRIAGFEIPCYVLEDNSRVITHRGLQKSLGMPVKGGATETASFIAQFERKGVDCKDLIARLQTPKEFLPLLGGRSAFAYDATVLADICDVVLAARRAGLLTPRQTVLAEHCEILMGAFARVGIIALVDEATGYQEIRDQQALQLILDQYIRKEFAVWAKRFPEAFYRQIFRLRGWEWRGMKVNRPHAVAHYTKDIVYSRLAPKLLHELETINPVMENGSRKTKHHQWLTDDIGTPALTQHLHAVIALMRASETWADFMRAINRAFPQRGDSLAHPLFQGMDVDESELN